MCFQCHGYALRPTWEQKNANISSLKWFTKMVHVPVWARSPVQVTEPLCTDTASQSLMKTPPGGYSQPLVTKIITWGVNRHNGMQIISQAAKQFKKPAATQFPTVILSVCFTLKEAGDWKASHKVSLRWSYVRGEADFWGTFNLFSRSNADKELLPVQL